MLGGIADHTRELVRARRFILTAQGTAWHAGLVGDYLFEDLAKVVAEATYASEFRYRNPIVEEGTVVNGFGAYMSTVIARQDPSVRVVVHGVPDRIVPAASRGRQLSITGLDAAGIAARVRALREQESEAVAG